MEVPHRLLNAARRLKAGNKVNRTTVRDFLSDFGVERRGAAKVESIQNALDALGLTTEPNFRTAWIDEPISLKLTANAPPDQSAASETCDPAEDTEDVGRNEAGVGSALTTLIELGERHEDTSEYPQNTSEAQSAMGEPYDPTFRIGSLPAANKKPVSLSPDDDLAKAVTIMLEHDFSQLPLMQGERDIRGVVTWKTIAARAVLAKSNSEHARDYREHGKIIEANRILFDVIPEIVGAGYAFIRHPDRKIKGPVTVGDLSIHFQALTEPFFFLREIELHVPARIGTKVTAEDLSKMSEATITPRKLSVIADLTFGEYAVAWESGNVDESAVEGR